MTHREEFYEEDLFIYHQKGTNYRMLLPHIHDGYELHFTLTDNTVYQIDGRSYLAKAGTIAAINDNEIHLTAVDPSCIYERIILSFRPCYIEEMLRDFPEILRPFRKRQRDFSHCIQLSAQQVEELEALMTELRVLTEADGDFAPVFKRKLKLLEVLGYAAELYQSSSLGKPAKTRPMSAELSEIVRYIDDNLREELSLDELSTRFFISKTNLIRAFKNETSLTPSRYIAARRVMKARELLREGLPVSVVSDLVGYRDQSSFIRVFKQVVGVTPKKYASR
ncbi:MAG: helix-turn-helix domain-containing protein [Oscillospiraceae bacterium]